VQKQKQKAENRSAKNYLKNSFKQFCSLRKIAEGRILLKSFQNKAELFGSIFSRTASRIY